MEEKENHAAPRNILCKWAGCLSLFNSELDMGLHVIANHLKVLNNGYFVLTRPELSIPMATRFSSAPTSLPQFLFPPADCSRARPFQWGQNARVLSTHYIPPRTNFEARMEISQNPITPEDLSEAARRLIVQINFLQPEHHFFESENYCLLCLRNYEKPFIHFHRQEENRVLEDLKKKFGALPQPDRQTLLNQLNALRMEYDGQTMRQEVKVAVATPAPSSPEPPALVPEASDATEVLDATETGGVPEALEDSEVAETPKAKTTRRLQRKRASDGTVVRSQRKRTAAKMPPPTTTPDVQGYLQPSRQMAGNMRVTRHSHRYTPERALRSNPETEKSKNLSKLCQKLFLRLQIRSICIFRSEGLSKFCLICLSYKSCGIIHKGCEKDLQLHWESKYRNVEKVKQDVLMDQLVEMKQEFLIKKD